MKTYLIIISLLFTNLLLAQDDVGAEDDYYNPTIPVGFVYVLQTDDYDVAFRSAMEASDLLDYHFDSTNFYDYDLDLTDTTMCGCGISHGYIARGRWDDGDYISLELSGEMGLSEENGIYVVVLASYGARGTDDLENVLLETVHSTYPEALYAEKDVYIGCMH